MIGSRHNSNNIMMMPPGIFVYRSALVAISLLILVVLNSCCVDGLLKPTTQHHIIRIGRRVHQQSSHNAPSQVKLNLFDNLFNSVQTTKSSATTQYPKVEVPPNFIIPEPRPLTITESTDLIDFITASTVLGLRLATGAFVLGWNIDTIFAPEDDGKYALQLGPLRIRDSSSILNEANRPIDRIVLYDNESSPQCKRVREMMNLLDITYEVRPTFTDIEKLPYIIDANINSGIIDDEQTISGDDAIITHLLQEYGPPSSTFDRKALWPIEFKQFAIVTSQLSILLRGNNVGSKTQQSNARPDNGNMKPIEFWSYECSPFVRPVKEKLSSLGLPFIVVSCSRGSVNRDRMVAKTGRFQVPYVEDPNTGIEMYESAEIADYLETVYTVKE